MTYKKWHEIDDSPETNEYLAEIIDSIKNNGWQGRPILAIDDQLLTGCHRYAACKILGVEPVIHQVQMLITPWSGDDLFDELWGDLLDAKNNEALVYALKQLVEIGGADAESLKIMEEED